MRHETAVFGAGCFWGVEVAFRNTPGVIDAVAGYCGGATERPTYEEVCSDETGHAEVVQVTYDADRVGYDQLLDVFFASQDPTTRDRQGPDVGRQYRSVIFYQTPEQRETAEAVIRELDAVGIFPGPIVTEVSPLEVFYPAEEYHQRYFERNPNQGYCQAVIVPKLAKLWEKHRHRM